MTPDAIGIIEDTIAILRSWGVHVHEVDGWRQRGRAPMGTVLGMMAHHDASNKNAKDANALNVIIYGRAGLPGPLATYAVGRDPDDEGPQQAKVYIVAAGKANHAGKGSYPGVNRGAHSMFGVEAFNNGVGEDWDNYDVYVKLFAAHSLAMLKRGRKSINIGHKEFATPRGRKIDPNFSMERFRVDVFSLVYKSTNIVPTTSIYKLGDRVLSLNAPIGEDIKELQSILGITVDGDFGPATLAAVKNFQRAHGLIVDGVVGKNTVAKLKEVRDGKTPVKQPDIVTVSDAQLIAYCRKMVDTLYLVALGRLPAPEDNTAVWADLIAKQGLEATLAAIEATEEGRAHRAYQLKSAAAEGVEGMYQEFLKRDGKWEEHVEWARLIHDKGGDLRAVRDVAQAIANSTEARGQR